MITRTFELQENNTKSTGGSQFFLMKTMSMCFSEDELSES